MSSLSRAWLVALALFPMSARAQAPVPGATSPRASPRPQESPRPESPESPESPKSNDETYLRFETFSKVLAYLRNDYVEDLPPEQLVNAAIQGMMAQLDPHSVYLPASAYRALKADGAATAGGIGLELAKEEDRLVVIAPFDETPAARAGLRPRDMLVAIDGEPTGDMPLEVGLAKLKGVPGTQVVLKVMRDGFAAPRELTIVRDRIQLTLVEGRLMGGIGYVRIRSFQDGADRSLKKELDALRESKGGELDGLVLDLRNDPGGLFDEGVRVADRFLKGGLVIVSTRGKGGTVESEQRSHARETEPPYPMVVLVNEGTASSSEIVTSALKDHGRAIVVGTKTFGKGTVQSVIELGDGSALKLTVARYFTPKGRSIHGTGIDPDIVITPREGKDASLERAVELLTPRAANPGAPNR